MRDPRINPRAGDVLRKKYAGRLFECRGYIEREVDEVYAIPGKPSRCQHMRVIYVGDSVCTPEVTLPSWRKWARNAQVIKVSDVA